MEKKYPIGGYAPGNYQCNCSTCAVADKDKFDALSPEEQEGLMKSNAEAIKDMFSKWGKPGLPPLPEPVYQAGYSAGVDFEQKRNQAVGLGLIADKASARQGAVWVKAKVRYPTWDGKYHIRQGDIKSAANLWQSTKEYWLTTDMEWLDEQAAPANEREQAIAFMNWSLESGCQYSCTDENQWTNINDPNDSITTAQLWEIWNKEKRK